MTHDQTSTGHCLNLHSGIHEKLHEIQQIHANTPSWNRASQHNKNQICTFASLCLQEGSGIQNMLQFWFELSGSSLCQSSPQNIRESTPKFFWLGTTGCFFWGDSHTGHGFSIFRFLSSSSILGGKSCRSKNSKMGNLGPSKFPPRFPGKTPQPCLCLTCMFPWRSAFDDEMSGNSSSTWYWQSLQIQSPSENDSGTQTLCWGGDWTPQSSAENMTIDAWGLKFCLTPVVYHFTLDNRFNAVFCVVKDRSSSPKYLPLLPVSSTNVLRQRQVTSLWFQPTSKVWLKFDHLPMVTTGSNITNAYKYIRTNTVPNHHFSKHCWFLQASPECSLVFHCSATLMLSWVVCWLDPIMAGYSSQPPSSAVASITWRIIPFSKWLITMVSKSPNCGYSLSKWPFHGF